MPRDKGPAWIYDSRLRGSGYRNAETGKLISAKDAAAMRDALIDKQKTRIDGLTDKLVDGKISVQQWTLEARKAIKDTYVMEYAASKGGMANVTQAEWGELSGQLRKQYEYLNGMAADIAEGKLSPGQINARSKLYIEGASQVYERGKIESKDGPELPAYPGDGGTACRSNCRCHWQLDETETEWLATWVLDDAEHCEDCIAHASEWAPLRITK